MAADQQELILTVPSELTKQCAGLAIDMGGSSVKFVYRNEEDFDLAASDENQHGRLRLVSFPRAQINEALNYIRQRAYLRSASDDQPLTLYGTGVGCTEYGKQICDTLNIKLQSITEFDCFVKSFHYLAARLPRHQLLEPFLSDAIAEPVEYISSHLNVIAGAKNKNLSKGIDYSLADIKLQSIHKATGRPPADELQPPVDIPLSQAEDDTYPCIMAMCGSAHCFMQIEKDGSFKVLDGSNRGGKSFIGVGALLTGCKTFDELIELAEKGHPRNVDQYSDELCVTKNAADGDESIYTLTEKAKPGLVFCFGKAAQEQDKLSREDIAAAWLQYVVLDLIHILQYICIVHGIRRAFFCGGFTAHPFIRHVITKELARRNMFISLFQQDDRIVTFDFVKAGQHLGALGCLISDFDKVDGERNITE